MEARPVNPAARHGSSAAAVSSAPKPGPAEGPKEGSLAAGTGPRAPPTGSSSLRADSSFRGGADAVLKNVVIDEEHSRLLEETVKVTPPFLSLAFQTSPPG